MPVIQLLRDDSRRPTSQPLPLERPTSTLTMKKLLISYGLFATLVACCGLTSCATPSPRQGTPQPPSRGTASHTLTPERYYNVETQNWEFERAG